MSHHAAAPADPHAADEHDAAPHGGHAAQPPLGDVFDPVEIREFGREDVEAGRNICKMLSLFFFYTVIVMGLSTYVTFRWVM